MDAIPKTLQTSSPVRRNSRTRNLPCAEDVENAIYSRSHCFTKIARDAVERLSTRLANQSTLTRMAAGLGVNDGEELEEKPMDEALLEV